MKKILLFVLCMTTVLALTACTGGTAPTSSSQEEVTQAVSSNTQAASENGTQPSEKEAVEPYYMKDIELTLFDGTQKTIGDYEGKPILLTFWASWCHYCNQQTEFLKELHDGGEVTVLAVNVGEDEDTIKKYVEKKGISYAIFKSGDALFSSFGGSGLPTNVFIGADTELYYIHPGYVDKDSYDKINKAVEEYLKERENTQTP